MKLPIREKGMLIILSSPSAGGKTTISKKLASVDNNIIMSISATTRSKRHEEIEGVNYFFKTIKEFDDLINSNGLLEYTRIYNNYYGTPKKFIEEQINNGKDVILAIDFDGMKSIKKFMKNAVSVFILPPTLEALEERIRLRGQDSEEQIKLRMSLAQAEIEKAKYYDYILINDKLNLTSNSLYDIIKAERLKTSRLIL